MALCPCKLARSFSRSDRNRKTIHFRRVCKKSRQFVKTIRRKRESQIRVQEKPLVFHPIAQQTVFRCRDARPLSRSFVRENQSLRIQPTPTRFAEIVIDHTQYFTRGMLPVLAIRAVHG
jgi:hypothetical protein